MRHLAILGLLAFGAYAQGEDGMHPRILANLSGRFVFGQVSDMRRDQYLLDTQTGHMWALGIDKDGNQFLAPIPFDGTTTEEVVTPRPLPKLRPPPADDTPAKK